MNAQSICWSILAAVGLTTEPAIARSAPAAHQSFEEGTDAYRAAEYHRAADCFRRSVAVGPATGGYHNLGNAEWRLGRTGQAVLAWERALWLDPRNELARASLRFARRTANLDGPRLAWYESYSTWLPTNYWPLVASVSLWLGLSLVSLPRMFRAASREWRQGLAAVLFAVFLLTLPALWGVRARARLGCILASEVVLRLTPTTEAEAVTRLRAGELARWAGRRGDYVFVRTPEAAGWVKETEFETLVARPAGPGG